MKTALILTLLAMVWQNAEPASNPGAAVDLNRKIVRNGGAADPEITFAPSITPEEASRETGETKQMLQAAEANLKIVLERQPDAGRRDVIAEVRNYLNQARQSLDSGDIERAHKLAVKASVLTNDMVRH